MNKLKRLMWASETFFSLLIMTHWGPTHSSCTVQRCCNLCSHSTVSRVYLVSIEICSLSQVKYTMHLFNVHHRLDLLKCCVYFGRRPMTVSVSLHEIKTERKHLVWKMRVIYRFLMSRGKGTREDALHRTNHSPSSWWLHTERKKNAIIRSFAFVAFASKFHRADLAGIPETMIKAWESRDEKRVRSIWLKKGRKKRRENRAREQDERPPESCPCCPPKSVGPLASSNFVSLPGAAMAKSV